MMASILANGTKEWASEFKWRTWSEEDGDYTHFANAELHEDENWLYVVVTSESEREFGL